MGLASSRTPSATARRWGFCIDALEEPISELGMHFEEGADDRSW